MHIPCMKYAVLQLIFRLSNIHHSPSEPALNRPNSSHTRSLSLSRNLASSNTETSSSECHIPHPTTAPSCNKPSAPKTAVSKPAVPPSFPVEISISPVRVENCSLNLIGGKEEKEGEDYIPMTSDKPSGLDLEDFLPVSNEVYNLSI